MINSLYYDYSSQKIQEKCENSFKEYQELQNKMTKSFVM